MIVAALETWDGGMSALYLASKDGQARVDKFIDDHYESGTFANLHTFDSEEEANKFYSERHYDLYGY